MSADSGCPCPDMRWQEPHAASAVPASPFTIQGAGPCSSGNQSGGLALPATAAASYSRCCRARGAVQSVPHWEAEPHRRDRDFSVTLPTAVLIAVTLAVRGFISFFTHYLMHRVPAFWRIHRVHHLDTRGVVSQFDFSAASIRPTISGITTRGKVYSQGSRFPETATTSLGVLQPWPLPSSRLVSPEIRLP